ncbi:hypothetical protein JCM33374_g3981 [Metschnikowia sp. JCM 33374]|nr:hypothetical protein JCM33374_g3981 [Metschnikowia sp. JCM 33374]
MDSSSNYYSSSLLSAYLGESESASGDQHQLPQIHIEGSTSGETYLEENLGTKSNNSTLEKAFSNISLEPRHSTISTASSASTVFSSMSSEKVAEPSSEDEQFFEYVVGKLKAKYYRYEKRSTLNVNWGDAAEVLFFGDSLDSLFTDRTYLLNYLVESSYELGEVRFSNLSKYHTDRHYDVTHLLKKLRPNLQKFNGVMDLYAESDVNIESPELFEIFSSSANHSDGLCIPLAISMFGNWLLTYNKDKALASNYENSLILDYFRKAARLSLVLRKVKGLLEENAVSLDKATHLELNRYWDKDNQNALSASLYGLGEYYQFTHNYDVAVTLWELNCHLTGDRESGHLAILGLTDGFGLGNRSKEHNRFGRKSRSHKFNTKRRIAHLYRILMKQPGFDEYGVSWATKEKYD